jgi:C4-dicarboxylate-specific signal transduction histidine kinase
MAFCAVCIPTTAKRSNALWRERSKATAATNWSYRVMLPGGQIRWIASRGRAQFSDAGTPILVREVSLDVTERRKTEREAQLLRQEVAHVGRVSMMGQLASALAHEINQPLGAILRNAEAAELFMQSASPDLDEVRASLADIIKNDQRAGAVIDRMRALLKRHELEVIRLDVGDVIGDVVTLMRADAVSRHVKLDVDIAGRSAGPCVATACIFNKCCSTSCSTAWMPSTRRTRRSARHGDGAAGRGADCRGRGGRHRPRYPRR